MGRMLGQAGLTGAFCVVFAFVANALLDAVSLALAIALPFVSGFLGSLVAQTILRRGASGDAGALRK